MMRQKTAQKSIYFIIFFILVGSVFISNEDRDTVYAQIPTGTIPTVTSTPSGPVVTVRPGQNEDFINVRSGPNSLYPKIGVLLLGQSAPAKGRSPGGEWILIEYPGVPGGVGWVYANLVNITPGDLSIVEPPPAPTPEVTQTIDPTLAAQFIVTSAPTRLPTFTPPPPLVIPTFEPASSGPSLLPGVPMGLVILVVLTVGILIWIFSFMQRR
jgi:hypothetical protein